MPDELITKIIKLCLSIDEVAQKLYKKFEVVSSEKKLENFWAHMAAEEKEHVLFWKSLLKLSKQELIPQVFDEPQKVIDELDNIKNMAGKKLLENYQEKNISYHFLTAYRMEFYLLHSAFESLFHYTKLFNSNIKSPEDTYSKHLNHFVTALNQFGKTTPELELLGETLQILWKENRKLNYISTMDELTGILNRRGFYNIIKPLSYFSSRNNEEIGIMMIDIDFFKKINDLHGHANGDIVLKQVANILKNNIRKSDVVARYGGEEFIIFLPSTNPETITKLGEKLRETVEAETLYNIKTTISVGVSYGTLGINADKEIINHVINADNCLYEAKANGRNKVITKHLVS